jgi:hypothetical protein
VDEPKIYNKKKARYEKIQKMRGESEKKSPEQKLSSKHSNNASKLKVNRKQMSMGLVAQ